MKKLLVALLAVVLALSVLPVISFADDSAKSDAGGLDFYAITIEYEEPVVTCYRKVAAKDKLVITKYKEDGTPVYGKGYVFADPETTFVLRAGDIIATAHTFYEQDAQAGSNFYEVGEGQSPVATVRYSNIPYKLAYITSINDGVTIRTKQAVNFYGIMEIRDDAGNANPNLVYDDATGYPVAEEKDADGNNYLCDDNGYILDANKIWHDSEGRRVEPFYEGADGNYVWIPLADRIDAATGRIKDVGDMGGYIEVTDDKGKTKSTFVGAELFRVVEYEYDGSGKIATEKNGTPKYKDVSDPAYNAADKVFTSDNILIDSNGRLVRGSPVIGTIQTKAKIKKISIQIDALGDQIYADAASDPQNKNTITVTVNNPKDYIDASAEYGESVGVVLGTVNSKTTKTEMDWTEDKTGAMKASIASIDLPATEEVLANLPDSGLVYLEFAIETLQPDAAFDASKMSKDEITTETRPVFVAPTPAPKADDEGSKGCKNVIVSGTAFAMITLLGACVVLKKRH